MDDERAMATTVPDVMQAVVRRRYGPPAAVLEAAEVPVPEAGRGEVLVRVAAAGVDRGVLHLVEGLPWLVRPAFGIRRPRNPVPGLDLAGTVVAIGAGVDAFAIGDEVLGIGIGSFAEYARARADKLAARPASIDPATAAAVPVSGLTALQAVRDVGRVAAGDSVVVLGASGGVGSFAVQLAVGAGATVTAVASAAKLDLVRLLGAAHVFDYATTAVDALPGGYDVILDAGGANPLRSLRRLLAPEGRLVVIGAEGGGRLLGGTTRLLQALVLGRFGRGRAVPMVSAERGDDVAELARRIDAGELVAHVGATYELGDAVRALDDLAAGRIRGKAVLVP